MDKLLDCGCIFRLAPYFSHMLGGLKTDFTMKCEHGHEIKVTVVAGEMPDVSIDLEYVEFI